MATTVADVSLWTRFEVVRNNSYGDHHYSLFGARSARKGLTSMAFIPTANCVQGRAQYQETGGTVAENIFYFATTGVPTMSDMTEIGETFQDWALEDWTPLATINWKMVGLALRAMNEEEGLAVNFTDGFPVTGASEGGNAPLQVSYTVTWSTGLVGRSARGRTYGVGLALSSMQGSKRLTDAAQAAIDINWTALMTNMATVGHALQVVSFQEGGVPREAGRKLPVLDCNVRFPLATQRRRLS